MTRRDLARCVGVAFVLTVASACSSQPAPSTAPAGSASTPLQAAREGGTPAGARSAFVPVSVQLPSGTLTDVEPARTLDGVLDVPEQVDHAGWWDGSAEVGDPYGTVVIAGHVDSRTQGIGAFAELLEVGVGEQVSVASEDGERSTYEISTVQRLNKDALSTDSDAFDQRGAHRLVLITCTGRFDPATRSYTDNLVVFADPVSAP